MKKKNRFPARTLLAAASAMALWSAPALAQHSHGAGEDHAKQPGHEHGPAAKAPEQYQDAVKQIHDRLEEVGAAIEKGDMDAAHDEADAAGTIGKTLGSLALKPGSGVPRDKVKDVNLAGKAIAEQAEALHEAVEKNDKAAVKAAYDKMNKALETLGQFVSAQYVCPMHCEGSKTYAAPGQCPVCKMALKKVTTDQYSCEIKPVGGGPITPGKPATLAFAFKDPTGAACKDFNIVHEKPLHLLMVSNDLSWYAHEHPEVQSDGTFKLTFTFPAGGEYRLFNDFTPKDVGMQVVPVTLKVEGAAPAAKPLTPDADKPKTVEGYTVSLDTGGPVKTGDETHLAYTITKDGKPVTDLRPYLGAMGHLVIISQDQKQFVHSHPHDDGDEHAGGGSKTGPKVDFEAVFAEPGLYKGWAQFQVSTGAGGKVITVPFTFNVAKGEGTAKPHTHHDGDHQKKEGHGH